MISAICHVAIPGEIFPGAKERYQFINRGKHSFLKVSAEALRQPVDSLASLGNLIG